MELDNDRVVPLANFRGSVRPVLLAGSQGYLNRALKASELFRTELRARGISVIPIALTSKDPGEKLAALKREFRCAGLTLPSCTHNNALPTLVVSRHCDTSYLQCHAHRASEHKASLRAILAL